MDCISHQGTLMKDRISLIAAAAGGFMLSIAVTSIIHAAPVSSLKSPTRVETLRVASLHQSDSHASRRLRMEKITK